jgi:hypothetical protein
MSLNFSKIYYWLFIFVFVVTNQSCSTSQKISPVATKFLTQTQPTTVEALNLFTPTPYIQDGSFPKTSMPTIEVTQSPTPPLVTVIVVNGDLSIRTGPDMSFDAIAKLKDGETVTALARSIMDGWIQIPSQSEKTGWISIQTNYSIVSGNLLDLPRVDTVEWNVGSYLKNCTTHQMIVKPGEVIIQPVGNSTEGQVWFSPGTYSVYDLDVAGQPVVANLTVREHSEYNIRKDGNGQRWDCP